MKNNFSTAISVVFLIVFVLFVGVQEGIDYEDDYIVLFIKKYPTYKIFFYNAYNDAGDHPEIEDLDRKSLEDLVSFCKYRFGFAATISDIEQIRMCVSESPLKEGLKINRY